MFSHNNQMNGHSATVHEEKTPFKCDICDRSCSTKSNMKTHIHEGKKNVKCDFSKD